MTTTNTANTNVATLNASAGTANDAGTAETVKQTRVTLISALLAKDVDGVAAVLLKQGRTQDEIKSFADTLKKAVPSFKALLEAQEAQRKLDEEEKEKQRQAEEEARNKAASLIEDAKKVAIANMVKELEKQGISPEMALSVAQSTMGGGSSTRGSTAPKARVKCVYNGTEYLVAVTGNNKDDTKAAIAESGLERAEFIEKYKAA